ncbi:MAG: hypothetical protein J0H23_08745 [Micrococcales bacterium]|nr:hypothetical protein [Micrococcales bacterium]
MRARAVAAIALSGALVVGLSGCALWQQPETGREYDASDGVSLNLGDLELRNVLVLTEDGDLGNLVGTAVNTTGADIDFTVQWNIDGTYHEVELTARAHGRTSFGTDGDQVTLQPLGEKAGSMLDTVVHISSDQKELRIPVLDATLPEYDGALPTPTPTPTPRSTPSPSATPEG